MNKEKQNATSEMDAIDLLTTDHHEVEKLFKQYKKLKHQETSSEQRKEIADRICQALSVHAQIEEEIFYPALREALTEGDLIDEAQVEHANVKSLIEQIMSSSMDEPLYDARVMVLSEYVEHHVKEEEGEIFKKARKAKVDIENLGTRLSARKTELLEARTSGKQNTPKHRSPAASRTRSPETA